MALLRNSIPMVLLSVSAAALYARSVSSHVRPGFVRLLTLLPVCAFFVAVPLAFSSAMLRCIAALFLAWLGTFKVLLLAVGSSSGPLDPSLPTLHFLLAASLPVELVTVTADTNGGGGRRRRRPGGKAESSSAVTAATSSLVSCAFFKVAAGAAIAHFHQSFDHSRLHLYVRLLLYAGHLWLSMEVLFACIAAASSAALMGLAGGVEVTVKPQFVRPYLATSLRDFWGRRWNLAVSAVLRASVYDPVRARAGKEAGILATFLVSGLMHEALLCYATLLRHRPTGEMAAFFLLHGAGRVAEDWCARRWEQAAGCPPPPWPLPTLLLHAFMAVTLLWLVLQPVYRRGRGDLLVEDSEMGQWLRDCFGVFGLGIIPCFIP